MKLSAMIPLILFLVVATLAIGLMNPSFAIFPVCVLFLIGVGLFFRPAWGKPKRRKPRPSPKPFPRQHNFDGPYSPHAYSRLSLLDEVSRKCPPGSAPPRRDQDIGAEVRARIAADPALHAAGIEAESRFGRVTLLGHVKDEADRSRARDIAEEVPGVVGVSVQIRLQRREGTA